MRVAVLGLGYVGLTVAVCLTRVGHEVFGVDVSEDKVRKLNAGHSTLFEPGVQELLAEARLKGLLSCSTDLAEGLDSCELAIVCVGTPSSADGSHNMTYIIEVTREIAQAAARRTNPLVVAYRSTIRPGTIEGLVLPLLRSMPGEANKVIDIAYYPEFLRESSAVKDFFDPPKIVMGTSDGRPREVLERLNKSILGAAEVPTYTTSYKEAEFTKFVDNAFHACKVSFANEIGRVCVQMGIRSKTIHEIFIADRKLNVSPYYLRPGGAFGGSCLPKDLRALQFIANDVGATSPLLDSITRSNEAHKRFIFEYCTRHLQPNAKILMVGLAFKSGTDDLRESPNVDLTRRLLQVGFQVHVFDPSVEPATLVGQNLGFAFTHLPNIADLLVSSEYASRSTFDAVIDTNGTARSLGIAEDKIIRVHALP
jgi:GDP-mannose 6-dehydrogenase